MPKSKNHMSGMTSKGKSTAEEAINHLRDSITSGKHWYPSLLEAMGLWTAPEETYKGSNCRYIIGGEAFDWLLLAQRLCDSVDGLISQNEREQLLREAKPPMELTASQFRRLTGSTKYKALLNYWYGVDIERAFISSIEEDIHKERLVAGYATRRDVSDEAYRRAYGISKKELVQVFRREKGYSEEGSLSESDLKEFTYWLFKFRLEKHDKARIASDTKRGIDYIQSTETPSVVTIPLPFDDPNRTVEF